MLQHMLENASPIKTTKPMKHIMPESGEQVQREVEGANPLSDGGGAPRAK